MELTWFLHGDLACQKWTVLTYLVSNLTYQFFQFTINVPFFQVNVPSRCQNRQDRCVLIEKVPKSSKSVLFWSKRYQNRQIPCFFIEKVAKSSNSVFFDRKGAKIVKICVFVTGNVTNHIFWLKMYQNTWKWPDQNDIQGPHEKPPNRPVRLPVPTVDPGPHNPCAWPNAPACQSRQLNQYRAQEWL